MMGLGPGPERLDYQGVTVFKMAHVQLAQGGFLLRTVGPAIDHRAAHAADALPAIVVEGDGFLALQGEALIDNVQHFQK